MNIFENYRLLDGTRDEGFAAEGSCQPGLDHVLGLFSELTPDDLMRRQRLAESAFLEAGITFSVYSDERGTEKIFPFDLIPRLVAAEDWKAIERGLEQRVEALDLFLDDIYGDQRFVTSSGIAKDVLDAVVFSSSGYLEQLRGVRPPTATRVHISGIDLVRSPDGRFLVLEDNARVPSGVSYVLENRQTMKRVFPRLFAESRVRSVDDYPLRLRQTLLDASPVSPDESHVVVLTPGPFNSAYFEHSFLARRMGCPLVQGSDLFVKDKTVYVRTTRGPERVDVIYRRIDDDFLDPDFFRSDSVLGVKGLMEAFVAGNVSLANAPGNGVADDKGTYALIPELIRFYLSEEPLLGQVETYLCARPDDLRYVLDHLAELVVKPVGASGGYGMLIGPQATRDQLAEFGRLLRDDPKNYIAQPLVSLSACPCWIEGAAEPRRVDLRPFVLRGQSTWVLPGGLTRVALERGSYVVNSSQGGGSKDTWVLRASENGGAP
ncbi:MAG: circularly permuted type 2 ATP-grasp protein [Acidobacteriota bacterium]